MAALTACDAHSLAVDDSAEEKGRETRDQVSSEQQKKKNNNKEKQPKKTTTSKQTM